VEHSFKWANISYKSSGGNSYHLYTKLRSKIKCRTPPPQKKGESPPQTILKCITKTASASAPAWLIPLPRFAHVHVWVTFIGICFTCSQILVPLTVLSHLAFLLGLHLWNKDTSCCVCKEPCHSGIFFLLLGPSIFYYQPPWGEWRDHVTWKQWEG